MHRIGSAAAPINERVEPRSVMLFFALLAIFIVVLALRAHMVGASGRETIATANKLSQVASIDVQLNKAPPAF